MVDGVTHDVGDVLVGAATMSAVDRYGFEVVATTAQGRSVLRLGFPASVITPEEVRAALVAMVRHACSEGGTSESEKLPLASGALVTLWTAGLGRAAVSAVAELGGGLVVVDHRIGVVERLAHMVGQLPGAGGPPVPPPRPAQERSAGRSLLGDRSGQLGVAG
jgi:hypothetical protein